MKMKMHVVVASGWRRRGGSTVIPWSSSVSNRSTVSAFLLNQVSVAANPETQPFVQAYQGELEDDNEEFAHLDHDEASLTFVGGNDFGDEGEDDDDDENEPPEVVRTRDLQEELRKVARGEKVSGRLS